LRSASIAFAGGRRAKPANFRAGSQRAPRPPRIAGFPCQAIQKIKPLPGAAGPRGRRDGSLLFSFRQRTFEKTDDILRNRRHAQLVCNAQISGAGDAKSPGARASIEIVNLQSLARCDKSITANSMLKCAAGVKRLEFHNELL